MATFTTRPPRSKIDVPSKPFPARGMGMVGEVTVDVAGLYRALKRAIAGEVRFGTEALALYATDSSNFRQAPLGVVIPKTVEDIVAAHRLCHRFGAPILNRGGGTSLSGETVNNAVVIDSSKYLTRVEAVDVAARTVTTEVGVINEQLNLRIGKTGFIFGPDPSSHAYCTIGGNLGNNSCGVHSVQSQLYGPGPRTSDNVRALEVVTYDGERFWVGTNEEGEIDRIVRAGGRKGEIYGKLRALRDRHAGEIRRRFPPVSVLPRRVSGYNLDELLPERGFNVARALVGTEGTCVSVLRATLLLTPALLERVTVVVEFDALADAAEQIEAILEWKPIALEGIDDVLFEDARVQPAQRQALAELPRPGDHSWLLVQFGSDSASEVRATAEAFEKWLVREKGLAGDRVKRFAGPALGGASEKIWGIREAGLGATAFPPDGKDHWPGWEDSAVPPSRVSDYVRDLRRLYEKHGLRGAIYGHFGQGCIHSRISFDLRTAQGLTTYRRFMDDASDLVVSYGGSLSGEHGDGQQRAEFLGKQFGAEIVDAMREFKLVWDPDWKMNPGKVIDPYRIDQNLKLGVRYNPPRPRTKFAFQKDGGDFAHAALRCVGVGKCRKPDGADVMCPSYIVTREEKHTTRGRARLLFEMLQGDVVRDGWKSEEVRGALDLCLACKGCTNDCPVNVDMPTLKAEFLYHHYEGLRHNRGRHMYAFGFVDQASRLASLFPEIANALTQAPGLSRLAKWAAGIDRRRRIPRFAPTTLQAWFRRRGPRNPGGERVVLWPDTFNNHFHTEVGVAAVEALEAAGYRVSMPFGHVCCGRPLYDYGFLDAAERYLKRTLRQLRDEIRSGTPVIGLEPSCVAVFKDEMLGMLPHDDDVRRLADNVAHFSDFLAREGVALPRLPGGRAVVWGHCHQKATGGTASERDLLGEGMGLSVEEAKGGCCGLAGSFGFEAGKYDISMRCGEVGWLPAARKAPADALLVADGFSCKTQLEQSDVGRRALHLAEVIGLARRLGPGEIRRPLPEKLRAPPPEPPFVVRAGRTAVALGVGVAAAALALRSMRRRRG